MHDFCHADDLLAQHELLHFCLCHTCMMQSKMCQPRIIHACCIAQMMGIDAPRLVRTAISRLAEEGEEDWVGWLCCELAVQVPI